MVWILGDEAATVEYRGFGIVVFVSDLSLDTVVFGLGFEIGNFVGARGRGVGAVVTGSLTNLGNGFHVR